MMSLTTKENGTDRPGEPKEDSGTEMFKSQFETFLRKFEVEWHAERDSEPSNIEDAQYIISSALDDLLLYRSQIVSDPENKLIPILTEALKTMKKLGYHQLYIDGGNSFRMFWEKGIGSCYLGWFDEKQVKKILKIPKSKKVVMLILLGYFEKEDRVKKCKDLDIICSYNKY